MTYKEWKDACYATGKVANEEHFRPDNWGPGEELIDITFTNGATTRFILDKMDSYKPSIWNKKQHLKEKPCSKINSTLDTNDFIARLSVEVF